MRILFIFLSALMVLITPFKTDAVEMQSIYQASVPVASQSDADRVAALQKGLEQVLIEVSGNSHILDNNAKLKASLAHAEDIVQQYSYATPPQAPKITPYLFIVRFEPEEVNRLLRDAGTATWGQNRPLILVWLAYEAPGHPADIVDTADKNMQVLFKNSARQRGLPLIFPVMDASEVVQLNVGDVLNKAMPVLKLASVRYASHAILIGHLTQTAVGVASDWQLILGPDQWAWSIAGKDPTEVFTGLVNNISDKLAERYSAVVTNAVQSHVTLQVTGLKQQTDLADLMKYLQQLTPVADVQLKSVAGDAIILDVNLRGNEQAFIQAASLGNNLEALTSGNPQDGILQYKWKQ
jgi:hypothetical protein